MVTSRQSTFSSTRRDAWVEVDLGAIEHNVNIVRSWLEQPQSAVAATQISMLPATGSPHPRSQPMLMAVVKSDAYGHGAGGVAEVLVGAGADWFAVASVDEGCQLRAIDDKIPILLLSPVPAWAVHTAIEFNLDLTVTSAALVADIGLAAQRQNAHARVHIKVDTGMHRLGIAPERIDLVLNAIQQTDNLQLISVFSHLAKADDLEATRNQDAQFNKIVHLIKSQESELRAKGKIPAGQSILFHLASGDAARRFPFTHYDMARVGLLLYGLEPKKISDVVVPAMSVRARINHIRDIESGESAGYSWTWTAKRPTRLASVPIGYADGVDRALSNRLTGLLMGQEIRQVGTISMDQMLFDITDLPEAQDGDVITLIGTDGSLSIQLAGWAAMLDTITYELACRMRVRLPRVYTRHRQPTSANSTVKDQNA